MLYETYAYFVNLNIYFTNEAAFFKKFYDSYLPFKAI